jgi:hypothetical protein
VRDVAVPRRVGAGDGVDVTVDLRNRARRGGDEVVLVFAERTGGPPSAARRQLVAFARARLAGDARGRVRLSFPVARLAVTHADGSRAVVSGAYRLRVGGQSATFTVG